jgi:hypothetical protein
MAYFLVKPAISFVWLLIRNQACHRYVYVNGISPKASCFQEFVSVSFLVFMLNSCYFGVRTNKLR